VGTGRKGDFGMSPHWVEHGGQLACRVACKHATFMCTVCYLGCRSPGEWEVRGAVRGARQLQSSCCSSCPRFQWRPLRAVT
jgi:hypothetical protein